MSRDSDHSRRRFPTTRWSAIESVRTEHEDRRMIAFDNFLKAYDDPLLSYLRGQFRLKDTDARDLLHEFYLQKLIKKDLIAKADRERGKFRGFLLQALNRFVIDELRKARARRVAGEMAALPLDELPEKSVEHLTESSAERFDLEFAKHVVHQAVTRMQHRCQTSERGELWRVFQERVLESAIAEEKPLPYEQLVPLLGLATPAQAANLLTTAKRMFVRVFRSVVRDYEATDQAVEEEIRALRYTLSNAIAAGSIKRMVE